MKLTFLSPEQLHQTHLCPPDQDTIHIYISRLEGRHHASSQVLLRKILSLYLDCPADSISFGTGDHGKPYLLSWERGSSKKDTVSIQFNLSHSGDYGAFAFSSFGPVGIDIEKVRPRLRMEPLVRRFFHPEEYTVFSGLDEKAQREFLFRKWTVREAFLKGLGTGLTLDPRSFCVADSGSSDLYSITKSQEDYSSWQIASVPAPADYFCSVAFLKP